MMRAMLPLLLASAILAPAALAADGYAVRPAPLPEPLPAKKFDLPDPTVRTLSNGLRVVIAPQKETPLWDARILFDVGAFADPEGKEGLASVTMDMLNEGAAGLSAEDISRRLRLLGSRVDAYGMTDASGVTASGPKRALAETLDLWAQVLLQPDFPQKDWEILQAQRLADLKASREDPGRIMQRVTPRVVYGDTYRGRLVTEASLGSITPADMKAFHQRYLGPKNAIVMVGGDVNPDEIVALLEKRLGAWKPEVESPTIEPKPTLASPPVLYLVDKPGAAQSVIRAVQAGPTRKDADYYALLVAHEAFGGSFVGRVNMNLREEKGYSYGAYCAMTFMHGPGLWSCSANVETSVTGASLREVMGEIDAALATEPLTDEEIAYHRKGLVQAWPGHFERTSAILDIRTEIWQYGLPEDWAERYVPGVEKVTTQAANAAFRAHIDPKQTSWLVVGDASRIRADVQALGFTIVELDRDGRPVAAPTGEK